ncbi:hypothetical protein BR93DRAFT_475403 [Coniochaeta sp. PMI_546]|nr:hypothetical protein BR93DRAFT_475403 [Coniochaeta sp. PMI_546]
MKWHYPLALVTSLAGIAYTEILDLGDLEQFAPKLNAPPDGLNRDAIWINQGDGGFNIALGPDLQAKLEGVLEACGKPIDNKCFQDAVQALQDGSIQMDKKLEGRQLLIAAATVATVFQSAIAIVEGIVLGIAAVLALKPNDPPINPNGQHWPEPAASAVGGLPVGPPVTVSAGGSAVITITKTPTPTASLEGSVTPAVTAVTAAADGAEKGDLVAVLDKDLASRLDEFMHRSKDCQAGADFDKENPTPGASRKRAGGSFGQALCASQAAFGGIARGGPFNDVQLINPGGVHFQFAQAAGPAVAALNQLSEFVRSYARVIGVPPEVADVVAPYLMTLAIETIVDNIPISDRNVIKATKVSTSPADPTKTSQPGCPPKNELICGITGNEDCAMKIVGEGDVKKAVCESGDKKDCECTGPSLGQRYKVSGEYQKKMVTAYQLFSNKGGGPPSPGDARPECPVKVTDIPAEMFSSSKMNLHSHFCQGWVKEAEHVMTVNATGANILPEPQLKAVVGKRTPPANPSSYKDWTFALNYAPNEKGGICKLDCNAAYSKFASACAASSPGVYMYEKGSMDVGCGTFAYQINKPGPDRSKADPPVPLKENSRFCYKTEDFGLGGDVQPDTVKRNSGYACAGVALQEYIIKKDDKKSFRQTFTGGSPPYQYNIWWKEGCTLENGMTSAYAADPYMQGADAGYTKCQETLISAYEGCTANGGRGGILQVGCLMFEFSASDQKSTW